MAWRRRRLPILWLLLLVGVVGFTLLIENVNREQPVMQEGLEQTIGDANPDAPEWARDINPFESARTVSLINVLIAGLVFYTVGVTLMSGETIPLDRQFKVSELLETLPISRTVYLAGKVLGAWVGLLVGTVCLLAMAPIARFPVPDPLLALAVALLAAAVLGLVGLLAGLWAEKMDQLATVTNFVVTPLAFLSGTFYAVERLPGPLRLLAHADPLFWMIDGFRAGLTGHAEGRPWLGVLGLALVAGTLCLLALRLLRRGWRLRA